MIAPISRRVFIKIASTTGAGLTLGAFFPAAAAKVLAADLQKEFAPNVWLRIDKSGAVTITVAKSDMGQGIRTSLPMIVAEELDADWTKVGIEQAPAHPKKYGRQGTGGSSSIRSSWNALRKAGAAAREMLISAAAQQWNVNRSTCFAESGTIVHRPSGRKLAYGDLVDAAAALPVPENPPLKDKKDYKLVGKWIPQIDTPDKSSGRAMFGIDVKIPGMLYATVLRSPVFGGSAASFDATGAKKSGGVRDVIAIGSRVAVVGTSTWAALKGRGAVKVIWNEGANASLSSEQIRSMFVEKSRTGGIVGEEEGDVEKAFTSAGTRRDAVYELPFLAHATMEPMNAVADVRPDRCEIWTGTQSPQDVQSTAAEFLDIPKDSVTVHVMLLGGGFGRRFETDFVMDAVEISRIMKAPVGVLWTREDDMQHDAYRPASYHVLRGALGNNGQLLAWTHRIVAPSISGQRWPESVKGIDKSAVECATEMPYAIPNLLVDYVMANTPVPVGWWRSVYASQNAFAVESFVDELAAAAGIDPVKFRLSMLEKSPRMKTVLQTVAEKAGWGTSLPKGRGRGVGLATSFGSHVAEVAEVSVDDTGAVRVHKVVAAIDCGMAVSPNTLSYNIEGAIVYGLSAALRGKITIEKGRVSQGSFHDYPMLAIDEMPAVEVHIIESNELLGGGGEPGLPPIAPAVCNAIFAATGKRIRVLPISG